MHHIRTKLRCKYFFATSPPAPPALQLGFEDDARLGDGVLQLGRLVGGADGVHGVRCLKGDSYPC